MANWRKAGARRGGGCFAAAAAISPRWAASYIAVCDSYSSYRIEMLHPIRTTRKKVTSHCTGKCSGRMLAAAMRSKLSVIVLGLFLVFIVVQARHANIKNSLFNVAGEEKY